MALLCLNDSRDSIVGTSTFLAKNLPGKEALSQEILQAWSRLALEKRESKQQLAFVWLANDLIQRLRLEETRAGVLTLISALKEAASEVFVKLAPRMSQNGQQ